MIYHHIKSLSRFTNLEEILLIGFYPENQFESFIRDASEEFGIQIRYLKEPKSLGTGGGLYHFKYEIMKGNPRYTFVLYGDICCSFPFGRMLMAQHNAPGTLATILAKHVTREESSKYGCLVQDDSSPESHFVRHYVEKPETFVSTLISCGVYLLDAQIFETELPALVEAASTSTGFNGKTKSIRLEQDILAPLASRMKVSFYETKDFWCQVKTPNSAITANKLYLEEAIFRDPEIYKVDAHFESVGPVHVHESATVSMSTKLGPNVSIGPDCVIGEGVRIRDSILLQGSKVGPNSVIINSILGVESDIGSWCRIEGSPDSSSTESVTLNGIKMPSITVLAGHCSVSDEKVIRNCIVLPHKDLHKSYQNEILL